MTSSERPPFIYKIFTMAEWQSRQDPFTGSADDERDGFIHFSTALQVPRTLGRYYSGEAEVQIAEFAVADLATQLKWEEGGNGDVFPHLYAPLSLSAMTRQWQVPQEDGQFLLPEELGGPA